MSEASGKPDFRDAAVAETERILKERFAGDTRDIAELGISYCVRVEGGPASLGEVAFTWLGFGGVALILAGLFAAVCVVGLWTTGRGISSASLVLSVFAIGIGCWLVLRGRNRIVNTSMRIVRERLESMGLDIPTEAGIAMVAAPEALSDVIQEDDDCVVLLYQEGFLQLEGLKHRFGIRADDVEYLERHDPCLLHDGATVIHYRVGTAILRLAIKANIPWTKDGANMIEKKPTRRRV